MAKFIIIIILTTLCVGCSTNKLSVHMDYLSHENLASYHVNTPDPLLNNPPIGQRLIVSWTVPKSYLCHQNLEIKLKIRFRNREEITHSINLLKSSGDYIYTLINDEYFRTGGIQTYLVELYGDDEFIEEWRHQLWTKLIVFDDEKKD